MECERLSQLHGEALSLWQANQYDACLDVLERLKTQTSENPKVLHNIAVVRYHKNGLKDGQAVLQLLSEAKARIAESGNVVVTSDDNAAYLQTAEESVATLNMAIIHFQLKEHGKVLALLEPLFSRIGPLDDGTSVRLCLLLLDIYIPSKQTEKARKVLGFLEKNYGIFLKMEDRDAGSDQIVDVDKEIAELNSGGINQVGGDSSSSNTDESDEPFPDTRTLMLPSLSKLSVVPLQLVARNGDARQDKEKFCSLDLKILVHLYRARLFFAHKNLRMVKREIRSVLSVAPSNVPALFLKAQLDFCRGNLRKAAKVLSRCVEGTAEPSGVRAAALCNMGVLYHHLGKHNSACLCFSNALNQLGQLTSSGLSQMEIPLPDPSTVQEQKLQIFYNAGLQHLLLKRFASALECFREASVLMFDKPILWLRMAECSLCMIDEALKRAKGAKEDPVVTEVMGGKGAPQVLVLPKRSAFEDNQENKGPDSTEGSPWSEVSSYLQNALFLVTQQQEGVDNRTGESYNLPALNGHAPGIQSTGPSKPGMGREDLQLIHQEILCKLAYVDLLQDQPEQALAHTQSLLGMADLPPHVTLLSHCYAAEALCLMDRPTEAADQLGIYMATLGDDVGAAGPQVQNNDPGEGANCGEDVTQLTSKSRQATLYVNLASVYATQGEFMQAQQCAKKASSYDPQSVHALLILIYVELAQGNKDEALVLMKRGKVEQ